MENSVNSGSIFLPLLTKKRTDKHLLKISKEEAFALRREYPDMEIYRTMRQRTNRGRFYVPEYTKVVKFLENFWKSKIDAKAGR